MHHRFVEIGIVVDDHGILAAHLANHALDMVLPGTMRVGFAQNFQTDFARAGKRDQMNLRLNELDGRADLAAALKQLAGILGQSGFA